MVSKKHTFRFAAILLSGFLLAMSTALVVYINSSFLTDTLKTEHVGTLFVCAYVVTILLMQNYGRIIHRFGNGATLFANMALQLGGSLVLAFSTNPWLVITAFVATIASSSSTIINYDIYLKELSTVSKTGRIRGMFWTAINIGYLVSPFLTGTLVDASGYGIVYLLSAMLMFPPFLLMFTAFRGKKPSVTLRKHERLGRTFRRLWQNRNLRGIFTINFILYFFYSWMVIYTPMYLHAQGITWTQIGIIFTVMLIPFVVVEYPAGHIADKYLGETEMMMLGLSVMALSVFGLLAVSSFWALALVLFCSRVGASLLEIMRESYFYKIVKPGDVDMIDTFRNTSSAAHVAGPVAATALLALGFEITGLFVMLGIMLMVAAGIPGTIEDTK